MTNNNIGVLFDLDGVILDTEGIYSEFWGSIDAQFPTGVENFTEVIKGTCLDDILNTYFPKENHAEIIGILQDFQKNMPYRYFPHAIEWVKALHEAGIPMCIVTSSDEQKMEAVYEQHPEFRGFFHSVIVGEMVEHAKPAPDCFLLGAKLLGKDIADCYIFEDSINGLKAALASGGRVIALSTSNPPHMLADARLVIPSFEDFTVEKMLSI
ncbi:MAG: HAD family hydrolase [Bacteroidales bacterium]|nr:HAD family hydrolase [Bacteroidales bacterium]